MLGLIISDIDIQSANIRRALINEKGQLIPSIAMPFIMAIAMILILGFLVILR